MAYTPREKTNKSIIPFSRNTTYKRPGTRPKEANKKTSRTQKENVLDNYNGLNTTLTCPVCHKTIQRGNYYKWNHGPNCPQGWIAKSEKLKG